MTEPAANVQISEKLAAGRQSLEELIDIAAELEQTRAGLANSAYLNVPINDLPPAVRKIWATLDSAIQVLPRDELLAKIIAVEHLLTVRLEATLPLIEAICSTTQRDEKINIVGFRGTLADLSRLASTALAIRIMAHRKRYSLPPAKLPVGAEFLRGQAERVRAVERNHKQRAVTVIDTMTAEAEALLQISTLASGPRASMQALLKNLQLNKAHLKRDGRCSELPIAIAALPPAPSLTTFEQASIEQHNNATTAAPALPFWRRWRQQLSIWLNTPVDVSWREAGRRTRSGKH